MLKFKNCLLGVGGEESKEVVRFDKQVPSLWPAQFNFLSKSIYLTAIILHSPSKNNKSMCKPRDCFKINILFLECFAYLYVYVCLLLPEAARGPLDLLELELELSFLMCTGNQSHLLSENVNWSQLWGHLSSSPFATCFKIRKNPVGI